MDNVRIDMDSLEAVEAALDAPQTPYDYRALQERAEELRAEAAAAKARGRRNSPKE